MHSSPSIGATRVLERPGEPPTLVLSRCKLVVIKGPDRGRELPLQRQTIRVGTSADNELALSDPAVSASHLELSLGEHGVLLHECGSTNGCFVEGHRIRMLFLNHGSEISLGETVLRFVVESGSVEVPLSSATNFGRLLGHSPGMRAAFTVLEKAARSDLNIVVMGESGTGKEIAAQALHDCGPRHDGPFVVFDCGAVVPSLIESHLFGHSRGAFTGADQARAGVFEDAHAGTLVLDEIGELPQDVQAKLLRAVETKSIQRVGDSRRRVVDVRIVACTNKNLEEEARAGRFREDLWFRLSVVVVHLPPLRERKEEIPRLVSHFVAMRGSDSPPEMPQFFMELLMQHRWPGNVRELRNVVERLCALPGMESRFYLEGGEVRGSRSESDAQPAAACRPYHESKREWVDRFEREYLARLLDQCEHNVSEVARVAGLARQSCHRLLKKHGLDVR